MKVRPWMSLTNRQDAVDAHQCSPMSARNRRGSDGEWGLFCRHWIYFVTVAVLIIDSCHCRDSAEYWVSRFRQLNTLEDLQRDNWLLLANISKMDHWIWSNGEFRRFTSPRFHHEVIVMPVDLPISYPILRLWFAIWDTSVSISWKELQGKLILKSRHRAARDPTCPLNRGQSKIWYFCIGFSRFGTHLGTPFSVSVRVGGRIRLYRRQNLAKPTAAEILFGKTNQRLCMPYEVVGGTAVGGRAWRQLSKM